MNNFKTFYTSIKKITDSYQDVVTTFQQSYNKTNNRVIPHEGFKNFKLISNVFITKGLKEGRFLKYFQLKGRSMNIFREDNFLDALKRIMDKADENEWYHINMICYNSYENYYTSCKQRQLLMDSAYDSLHLRLKKARLI